MELTSSQIRGRLLRLTARLRNDGLARKYAGDQPPLRSELFGAQQMRQHGKNLAGSHQLSEERFPDQLLVRLGENHEVLLGVRDLLTEAVKADRRITPAGEWLLDNFHLIEEQIHTAKRNLPKGYSRELPRLRNGPSAKLPRVYDIALETISHGDGTVDPENLGGLVAAYQTVAPLKLGELWAIPIMLGLALIENLRRVALRVATDRIDRNRADYWADRITEVAEKDPKNLILVIADMARSGPPLVSSFVAEFTRRLQGQGSSLALPLTWIEQQLSDTGLTIEQLIAAENKQQAADQASMSNSIGSLRFLVAQDWRDFVETMSVVDQTLRQDPDAVYGRMDFATRDRYRHAVEKIAKHSPLSEGDVAREAIQLARDNQKHVGFYLIDEGLAQLDRRANSRRTFASVQKGIRRFPLSLYVGTIALLAVSLAGALVAEAYAEGLDGWPLGLLGILSLLSASQLAAAVVNWLATVLETPQSLPRMDYSAGIPPEVRTLVVVPTMLMIPANIADLLESLEVRFLANRQPNLHFGLLTDFQDAHQEVLPEDERLLNLAESGIKQLNAKYADAREDTFFLFHRPRRWNAREKLWMGYERKRGKLSELNSFLRGGAKDRFSLVVGRTAVLSDVKYVITLDTDTQLPRDAAWQFVGAMAHPLNCARYDERKQRIDGGYGILQPRMAVSLRGANRSRYARLFGSEPGIDPYTRVVSDVYQDLFQEGSFIGKGIYDVDAFEQALNGRFPENRILSHDLLEGCYARSGLLSDVQLYEEYPALYSSDVSRRQRWIRGDWQIARWLLPGVPGLAGRRKNPLSALSRWKIFDNLRRSLVPAALTLMLLVGWIALSPAWFWTWAALGIFLFPPLLDSVVELLRKEHDVSVGQHLAASARSASSRFKQVAFTLACLPYEAYFSLVAIAQTLTRMLITRRRLLEWRPSNGQDSNDQNDLAALYRAMWVGPVLAVSVWSYLILSGSAVLAIAAPILALWAISPAITWWVNQPPARRKAELTTEQVVFLRKLSRKTWAFFEQFVGAEDHWLPPDNYQEHPISVVAHRTSPTNIGLSLLANLSAYDFGYIPAGQLIERTSNAFRTMEVLDRYRGHFYNWYDTQSLEPLSPNYVSTVDSGNLAGHLLTLRPGLLALPDEKILATRFLDGLVDTLRVLAEVEGKTAQVEVASFLRDAVAAAAAPPSTLEAAWLCLDDLARSSEKLAAVFDATSEGEAQTWARAAASQCRTALDDLTFLAPWILAPESRGLWSSGMIPTLRKIAEWDTERLDPPAAEFRGALAEARLRARARIAAMEGLARQCSDLACMEYGFLYDKGRHLLVLGFDVGKRRADPSFYDLLASEARLSTFVAIAQGQLPQESWFALGRLLTTAGGEPVLFSWGGSMFEYLMPSLVMPTYDGTLLDQTCKAVVKRQIEYGQERGVPWGISESGYNATDVHLNYQYRAFGVPGLGFKRGLSEDLVVAPYASALALMVDPEQACLNLERLEREGFHGKYGFYEAIDYTPSRLPRGRSSAVVRSFMAHHQGMTLLSLGCVLLDRPMQKRFESDPPFQASALLLQERIPRVAAYHSQPAELSHSGVIQNVTESAVRVFSSPDTPRPEVQLLSNGRYHVMISNAGGSYSRWKDIALTRWREDSTCDNWGTFCYIRDLTSGKFWSTAYQPTLNRSKNYEVIFSEAKAEFRRRDYDIETHTEIAVSPEDDVEIRRTTIINRSRKRRSIDVTSYAEVVLASAVGDALHPAFSNLFVQTEVMRRHRAIVCTRRPRSVGEQLPWMFHLMAVHGGEVGAISFETDRARFIGRTRSVADPDAMRNPGNLSGSEGSVLDPIVAIRHCITLDPDESATVNIVSGVGDTRDACINFVEKYQDRRLSDRVFDLAWTHSQVALQQLNATEADGQLYCNLAGAIIYANPSLRADPAIVLQNRRGQSGLWGYSVSGDLPIILLQIRDAASIDLVRQLVQAHAYWRLKGVAVDLVVWNEDHSGYRQLLHDQIQGLIAAGIEVTSKPRSGDIFVRAGDQISNEDRILFQSVARVIITDSQGTLREQVSRRPRAKVIVPKLIPTQMHEAEDPVAAASPRGDLILANGLGGFTGDGREYIITTTQQQVTPAPWANVLANPHFGTVISESGTACTWRENAHEFRLTPWGNDPVSDGGGEAVYLRDEESGNYWSPTPLPSTGANPYVSRHGFGYSVFEHTESGVRSEMWVYVAPDAPVKFTVLKVRNESGRPRRLSATGYVEWVLGDLRSKSGMHLATETDSMSSALFVRNSFNTEFTGYVGFFEALDVEMTNVTRSISCDRREFLGRNGSLRHPAAMNRSRLSGNLGACLDPCAAIQLAFDLADGQEREIIFILGAGRDFDDASHLVQRFRAPGAAHEALEAVWRYWGRTLGAVYVETPDPAVNVLANGWLVYQTLACRLWARSGYYQPGGAFGFRDQLQDVMALIHAEPQLVREHLLLCATRQFREGDVQHWWHPPSGRGVRTRCSDDFLWLPLVTSRYVLSTGDFGVLDEPAHFLEGRPVNSDEDSYYDLPGRSEESAGLYEHCVRAIERGLRFGDHGLPLMGTGDWNDGMDKVGEHGRGESVWLGFFLHEVLTRFADLARARNDLTFAARCKLEATQLRRNIDKNGWDGQWYRRAYFDDGTPLGSAANEECQIDSVAQSWSVLSGAGDAGRSRLAMESLDRRLVRREDGLVQLLDPPFDKSNLDPGYIKGYVPGVRENGGQYTHAAIWATMAFARLGDSRRAWELFGLINPVHHSTSRESADTYKVEPYVVAADVYAVPPHTGRGGWTWYTGSAGWMYRLVLESLLGLRLQVDKLRFLPCLPADWEGFTVHYRYRETTYHISVTQTDGTDGVTTVTLDGVARDEETIPLVDDHQEHSVELRVRRADSSTPIELDSDSAGHAEQLQTD